MEELPKKNKNNKKAFYGQLPVSKPEPILSPDEHIQLQTIVNPVAIVPYISYEQQPDEINQLSQSKAKSFSYTQPVPIKKAKNRVCGALMLLILLLSLMPFVLSLFSPYPFAYLEEYIGVNNIINDYKEIVTNKLFTNVKVAFPAYMVTIGIIALVINLFKATIALVWGSRKGYAVAGFFVFLSFTICGLFLFGFGNIKNIAQIINYSNGWHSITLMSIGVINFVFSIICTIICPKKYKIDTVNF